ncbi:MAG: energy transducer TonB [Acidobacteria bacterium]|nr:energy transducer TonB [Acidobacteriota bacterium]
MMKILKYFTAVMALVTVFFALDANAQQGAIMAVDEPPAGAAAGVGSSVNSGGAQIRSGSAKTSARSSSRTRGRNTKSTANSTAAKNAARQAKANKKYDGFVIGDKYTFLNFEVVSAEKPYYTRAAKENGAKGLVQVEILIDEDGSVLTAKARTGNKELWPEAERAALASKFNRPAVYGKAARATGFLVYRFGPAED